MLLRCARCCFVRRRVFFLLMWQANKLSIIVLAIGFAALGGAYWYLAPQDELLAKRVLYTGICALLFVVAAANWFSLKK